MTLWRVPWRVIAQCRPDCGAVQLYRAQVWKAAPGTQSGNFFLRALRASP